MSDRLDTVHGARLSPRDAAELKVRSPTSGISALTPRASAADALEVVLHAGQLLMQNGAESERVEHTLRSCGHLLGCEINCVVVTYDALIVTYESDEGLRTISRSARPRAVNMTLIEGFSHLTHQVERGTVDLAGFRARMLQIESGPQIYSHAFAALIAGVGCASFCRIFHGDWPATLATLCGASVATWLRQQLARHGVKALISAAATGGVSVTLVSLLLWISRPSATPQAALSACALMLVPGVTLINSVEDAIKGHALVALARATDALLVILFAAMGCMLATTLLGALLP
jgi:uncharacterized membrane protein YjjP (DUF1212 family)